MRLGRFPHCSQFDSRDCGAACLQMIAKYYGKDYRLQTLRDYSFVTREGASLMGISDAAETIGFRTSGVRVSLEVLQTKIPLPCILHWNQNHYVVCYRIRKTRSGVMYHIADPAASMSAMDEREFASHWVSTRCNGENCGILLALQPDTTFYELDDDEKRGDGYQLGHFFRYLFPYKVQIGESVLVMGLFMVLGLILPFLTQSLVDVGIGNGNLNFVVLVLVAQFILSFTSMSIGFLQSWISLHVNTRINIALVSDFWRKLMRLPLRFFDTKNTGDLMRRLGDHGRIESFLVNDSVKIAFAAINFVVYGLLLGYYNPLILLIFLIGHSLYVCWVAFFLHYRKRLDYKSFEIQSKNNSCVIQLLQGMTEIKLNNEESRKRWEWESIQAKAFNVSIHSLKISQIQGFGAQILTRTTELVITFIVAGQVINGGMTLGMMMALSYIIGQVSLPISQFIGFINSFQNAKISLERLNEIHACEDEDAHADELRNELPEDGGISIRNLSFSYSGSTRDYVLKNIEMEIPQRKVTAIVGMSGSGKTTVMKLLQGFYVPQEGQVKIGHIPLNSIHPRLWRSKIGAVMQDGYIFSDTIARNIAVGGECIDKERMRYAARMANIEQFIDELPLGFNTIIGMDGCGISQGQKQRILIARAIYKNPDYLFFDEATNALDSQNEKIIWQNLSGFFCNRTVVVCAHRLSTIKAADHIIVLRNGQVFEQGTHRELMEKRGEYYRLVENQMEVLS